MIKSEEQQKIGYLLEYLKINNFDRYYDKDSAKLQRDLRIVTIISELQKLLTEQLKQDYSSKELKEIPFAIGEVFHSRTKEVREAIKLEQKDSSTKERKMNTCKRCGWIWFPIKKISYECPRCQSPKWNIEKDKKVK